MSLRTDVPHRAAAAAYTQLEVLRRVANLCAFGYTIVASTVLINRVRNGDVDYASIKQALSSYVDQDTYWEVVETVDAIILE